MKSELLKSSPKFLDKQAQKATRVLKQVAPFIVIASSLVWPQQSQPKIFLGG
jgi:hypothetical protein